MYCTPYYENGVYHNHDPNRHSTSYECSNGHWVGISSYVSCPAGDYDRETTTTVRWLHDLCKNFGFDTVEALEKNDEADCSWCRYKKVDALRTAKREIEAAYKSLAGWNRRRKTLEQFKQEVRNVSVV